MTVWAGIVLSMATMPPEPLERVGRLDHPAIREASGIVASRRHPGIFWVHNDSGNAAALFAIRRDGSLVREYVINAAILDWEDIAIDDLGHLYLGDIGNNSGLLPVRTVYQIDEPDPAKEALGPLAIRSASSYRLPRGERFDAESLFVDHRRAIVIAKTFDRREAELFAVPLDPPAPILKPARPHAIGCLQGFREPATGADLSRDGRLLAVCANDVARVYERRGDGAWKLLGSVRFPAADVEAICWDGADLLLVSEQRDVFRIAESRWRKRQESVRADR